MEISRKSFYLFFVTECLINQQDNCCSCSPDVKGKMHIEKSIYIKLYLITILSTNQVDQHDTHTSGEPFLSITTACLLLGSSSGGITMSVQSYFVLWTLRTESEYY